MCRWASSGDDRMEISLYVFYSFDLNIREWVVAPTNHTNLLTDWIMCRSNCGRGDRVVASRYIVECVCVACVYWCRDCVACGTVANADHMPTPHKHLCVCDFLAVWVRAWWRCRILANGSQTNRPTDRPPTFSPPTDTDGSIVVVVANGGTRLLRRSDLMRELLFLYTYEQIHQWPEEWVLHWIAATIYNYKRLIHSCVHSCNWCICNVNTCSCSSENADSNRVWYLLVFVEEGATFQCVRQHANCPHHRLCASPTPPWSGWEQNVG